MQDFEVIVAGLGAYGSAALYQLAKAGVPALGLDRHAPPHEFGSSHGDTRITRLAIGEGEHLTPIVRRSHELWRQIEAESGASLLTQCGELIIASAGTKANVHVDDFFPRTVAAARQHGIAHELLDAAEIRRRFPQFAVRDDEYGYYEPEAGFLRPEACVKAQLDLARGAEIRSGETLVSWRAEAGGVCVVTDKGEYRAKRLILSAGAWMPALLGPRLAPLFRVTRQVLFWFDIARHAERFDPAPVFIWALPEGRQNLYGFPAVDGAQGGVKIASEQDLAVTTPEAVARIVSEDEAAAMYRDYVAPNLPDLSPHCLKAKTCLYTVTPDAGFVIDAHPDCAQVLIVSACSGHGFKHSAALGEGVVQWAMTGALAKDYAPFALSRFA